MFRATQFRKRCCTWRVLWAVHPWLWPVSLRMLCVVRQNEIRQRRKLVDRALCCVCGAINEYAHGRTTMGRRALPLTTAAPLWPCVEKPGILYVGHVKNTISTYTSNCHKLFCISIMYAARRQQCLHVEEIRLVLCREIISIDFENHTKQIYIYIWSVCRLNAGFCNTEVYGVSSCPRVLMCT